MPRHVKDNKTGFYKYIGDKRKPKKNLVPLLKVTQQMEETEVQSAFFATVLRARPSFGNSRSHRLGRRGVESGARKMYPWWKTIRSGNT